jgi:hypothetical protein
MAMTLPLHQGWLAWVRAMNELSSRLNQLHADIKELSPEDRKGGNRANAARQEIDAFIIDARILLGCKERFLTELQKPPEPHVFELNEDEYRLLRAFLHGTVKQS